MKSILTILLITVLQCSNQAQDSQAALAAQGKTTNAFEFPGGSLTSFVQTVKDQIGFDLGKTATIAPGMYSTRIPKMRISAQTGRINVQTVLALYNSISEKTENSLGRWIIEGIDGEPQTILLDESGRKHSNFTVKAFAFGGAEKQALDSYEKFSRTVRDEMARLERSQYDGHLPGIAAGDIQGTLGYHADTQIAVASGGKAFVELAATIYDAMKENMRVMPLTVPQEKTTKP